MLKDLVQNKIPQQSSQKKTTVEEAQKIHAPPPFLSKPSAMKIVPVLLNPKEPPTRK